MQRAFAVVLLVLALTDATNVWRKQRDAVYALSENSDALDEELDSELDSEMTDELSTDASSPIDDLHLRPLHGVGVACLANTPGLCMHFQDCTRLTGTSIHNKCHGVDPIRCCQHFRGADAVATFLASSTTPSTPTTPATPTTPTVTTGNTPCLTGVGQTDASFTFPTTNGRGTFDRAGGCLQGFNPQKLVQSAKALQYAYCRAHTAYSQATRGFGETPVPPHADCSSFVQSALDKAGYGCIFSAPSTAGMRADIARRGGGYHAVPIAGDLMMWHKLMPNHDTGHIAIVTDVGAPACPAGQFRIAQMVNAGAQLVPCATVDQMRLKGAGGGRICQPGETVTKVGDGCLKGFWTPQ